MSSRITVPSSVDIRLRHLARQIHRLGPNPLFQMMRQLASGDGEPIALFERYGALPVDLIAAYGGDKFPPNVFLLRPRSS
jgi:hypothetical protein